MKRLPGLADGLAAYALVLSTVLLLPAQALANPMTGGPGRTVAPSKPWPTPVKKKAAEPAGPAKPPQKAAPDTQPFPPQSQPGVPLDQPPAPPPRPPETVEIDVSTRTIAVTSAFSGTEIILFGSVTNSRQESAEAGTYDLVVVVEGTPARAVVRLKSSVGGLWINTKSVRFNGLPLYSAIAATRPLDEIAEPQVLAASGIGFSRARMFPARGSSRVSTVELEEFKSAFLRIKEKEGLYVRQNYGTAFIGRSLFRARIKLPANVPVGPLGARAYLFRDGALLATGTATVNLERQGLERLIYDFAYERPTLYGLLAVLLAASAGLAASAVFRRQGG